jgi:hypothetical protein
MSDEYREHWHATPTGPNGVSVKTADGHKHETAPLGQCGKQLGNFAIHTHVTGSGLCSHPIFIDHPLTPTHETTNSLPIVTLNHTVLGVSEPVDAVLPEDVAKILRHIQSMCGNPSAADACRGIIRYVNKLLGDHSGPR